MDPSTRTCFRVHGAVSFFEDEEWVAKRTPDQVRDVGLCASRFLPLNIECQPSMARQAFEQGRGHDTAGGNDATGAV